MTRGMERAPVGSHRKSAGLADGKEDQLLSQSGGGGVDGWHPAVSVEAMSIIAPVPPSSHV